MDTAQILRQAKEHFGRVVSDDLDSVEVPEWGTTLYFHKTMSLQRKSRIMAAQADGGLKHMAQIVIECACDEEGKRLFDARRHMDTFMKEVDSNVLIRIAGAMASALVPEDDPVGKFETTPSSESVTE